MNQIRPYEEIPLIEVPQDTQMSLATFLAQTYEQYGPILRHRTQPGKEMLILVGPEANRFVLVSGRQKFSHQVGWGQLFGVDPLLGHSLFTMDGSEHNHHRQIMNPAFTPSFLERYLPVMQRVLLQRTAHWAEIGEIDLYEEIRKITFEIAAATLTGLTAGEEVESLRTLFERILSGLEKVRALQEDRSSLVPLQHELSALLLSHIEQRRRKPTEDLLSLLVQARDAEGQALSDEQVISHVKILLLSGQQSATNLNVWLLYLLTQHPDYTRRVLEEQAALLAAGSEPTLEEIKGMHVLSRALMEAERLYPMPPKAPRGVVVDFEFNGYHVPAGTSLFCIAASHLLPAIFANPTHFDPDRFAWPREEHKKQPYALVGFGGGPHLCIGINFAQVEIKAITSYILRHYELEVLPGQQIAQSSNPGRWPLEGMPTSEIPPWEDNWPGQVKSRVYSLGKGAR